MPWKSSIQWSNQPGQNSVTNTGLSGCRASKASMLFKPSNLKLAVMNTVK